MAQPLLRSKAPRPKPLVIPVNGASNSNVLGPKSPATAYFSSPVVKTRMTLDRAWRDADQQFYEKTGKHLKTTVPTQKKGVINTWKAKYDVEDSDTSSKFNQMASLLQTILDGVEVIGAFAAQGASLIYAPAGMCFNAIAFLIEAPRQIKKVYDTLRGLFEEVQDFLVKFKVLKRIDDRMGLDEDLVLNTNKILISFVKICGLSIKLLEGSRFMTAAKVLFLQDDSGVGAELENFRHLAQSQSYLVGTVTLEHVLKHEEDVKEILASAGETNVFVRSLAVANNDEKTKLVNKGRIDTIVDKIFPKGERGLAQDPSQMPQSQEDLLFDTFEALANHEKYKQWIYSSPSGRAALFLLGPPGTGKSRMIEALKDKLDKIRSSASKNAPSTYVAFYGFSGQRTRTSKDDKRTNSSIPHALRSMAVQVAQQSTNYAKDLARQLQQEQNISQMDDIERLWQALRLSTFDAPPESSLYLLFDGVEQERESMIHALVNIFAGSKRQQKNDRLRVRAVLAGDPKVRFAGSSAATISMDDLNKELVQAYAIKEMKRLQIFQDFDKKSTARRELVVQTLRDSEACNFVTVRQKLERLRDAVDNDCPSSELTRVLADEKGQTYNAAAKQLLDKLAVTLSPKHISQLNSIIMWTLYSQSNWPFQIQELEAVLYLEQDKDTLESLDKKIKQRYGGVFNRDDSSLYLNPNLREYLSHSDDSPSSSEEACVPLITMNISIQDAQEKVVRQFIWNLNEQMSSGKFDFASHSDVSKNKIRVNRLDGHLTITRLCFKLLNEGWQEQTEAMVSYALDYTPKHLTELRKMVSRISTTDKKMLGQGLVGFLSDPYYFAEDPEKDFGSGEYWLVESEDVESVRFWLQQSLDQLQPHEARWVKQVTQQSEGRLGHMKQITRVVGRKWLSYNKNCLGDGYLFAWVDKFIEMNIMENREFIGETGDEIDNQGHRGVHGSPELQPVNTAVEANTQSDLMVDQALTDEITDLERMQSSVKLTTSERILRALNWLRGNNVSYIEDGKYHIRLGYTYFENHEYDIAAKHFSAAKEDEGTRRPALTALGRLNYDRGHKEEGLSQMLEAVNIQKEMWERNELSKDDICVYFRLLSEVAGNYEKVGQKSTAILLYDQFLKFRDDLATRWTMLKLLCEADRVQHAIELLEKWSEHAEDFGGKRPSDSIYLSADEDPSCEKLESLIRAIQDNKLRLIISNALAEAVETADKNPQTQARPGLLYLQGMMAARSPDNHRWQNASELWEEALLSRALDEQVDIGYRDNLRSASRGVALCKFDTLRARFSPNTEMSDAQKDIILKELKDYISNKALGRMDLTRNGILYDADYYIASMNVLLGRTDDAREATKSEMSIALDILRDDDPDNDACGIVHLIMLFCLVKDKVGALSAFSLLDRQRHAASSASDEGSRAIGRYPPNQAYEQEALIECDGCDKNVYSSDPDGIWWCHYCPDFQLCSCCYRKFSSGELRLHLCNPNHEFLHIYHTDYIDEEVAHGKIRIDWDLKTLEDGRFVRQGGKIVELSEWLEQLRQLWKLPESTNESRAQK